MVVEGGGTRGLFPVGEVRADLDADFQEELAFGLSNLVPYVALPYKPDNGLPVSELEPTPVDVAWIGSCTGGKLEDLAAEVVVKGRKVAPGVFSSNRNFKGRVAGPLYAWIWHQGGAGKKARHLCRAFFLQ